MAKAAPPPVPSPVAPPPTVDKDLGKEARHLGGFRPGDKPRLIYQEIVIIVGRPMRRRRMYGNVPLITYFPPKI